MYWRNSVHIHWIINVIFVFLQMWSDKITMIFFFLQKERNGKLGANDIL